jgi:hypothetical protein
VTTYFNTVQQRDYTVVIEDNGKVAYAYLIFNTKIIGDLWLYNQDPSPLAASWGEPSATPFLNPLIYVDAERMATPILKDEDVSVKWEFGDGNDLLSLNIVLRGKLYGIMKPGSKPGWTVAAKADSPLAKRLVCDER